jgi:cell fate regulator YaaT (PSP1 superfamily)
VPVKGVRAKLIPTEEELENCRDLGKQLAQHLTGNIEKRVISMSELLASSHA